MDLAHNGIRYCLLPPEDYSGIVASASADLPSKDFSTVPMDEQLEVAAAILETGGWKKDIAGPDWEKGLRACRQSLADRCGIVVTGPFGCGKTSYINAILSVLEIPFHRETYRYDLSSISGLQKLAPKDQKPNPYGRYDYSDSESDYMHKYPCNVFLDDLGAEERYSHYGIVHELAGECICQVYSMVAPPANLRHRLFITTNLTPEQLDARYGGRVCDRLKELCLPLTFKGKSKREWRKCS